MFNRKNNYIILKEGSLRGDRDTGIQVFPENRVTELSGKKLRWLWNRPKGIILQKGASEKRFPIIDLQQVLQAFLYSISLLLVMIGIGKMIDGQPTSGE